MLGWGEGKKVEHTLVDVALDHDTHDGGLSSGDLLGQNSSHLGLVLVVLLRVTVAAVDHEAGRHALGGQLGLSLGDALGIVVGALLATTEDDEAVGVAHGADDSSDTGLGDGQEVVRVLDGANGIDSDIQGAVGTVLETNGEGQTRGQFTVDLGLGGASTNGADGETVGQKLGGDGIEHLTGDGHTLVGQVDEKLTGGAKTLVDLEAVVNVGVVDETLPADGGTGLLEVGAHDNQQLILVLLLHLHEAIAVFEGHFRVVDGAGTDDNQQTATVGVCALDDSNSLLTTFHDRSPGLLRHGDLMLKEVGGCERVVSTNCRGKEKPRVNG